MKRLLFAVALLGLAVSAHAQSLTQVRECEQAKEATVVQPYAENYTTHEMVEAAIKKAQIACGYEDQTTAAPPTSQGDYLRAQAAVADDLQDAAKVALIECVGVKVDGTEPPTKDECMQILQHAGLDASSYKPAR